MRKSMLNILYVKDVKKVFYSMPKHAKILDTKVLHFKLEFRRFLAFRNKMPLYVDRLVMRYLRSMLVILNIISLTKFSHRS